VDHLLKSIVCKINRLGLYKPSQTLTLTLTKQNKMAKFIKFNVKNSAAQQPLGPTEEILVNVEDITKVSATGANGANAKTVVVGLTGRNSESGYKTLTLAISTSIASAVNPTLVDGKSNPLVAAVRSAMTANPGGVISTVSLGKDQAAAPKQMYFRTATFA